MFCRMVDAKPLSEPMLEYCKFESEEKTSNLRRKTCIFVQEIAFEYVVSKKAAILSRPHCVDMDLELWRYMG